MIPGTSTPCHQNCAAYQENEERGERLVCDPWERLMDGPVVERIQRIYAALGETVEGDLAAIPPVVEIEEGTVTVWQDFTGGLSEPQLSNLLQSLIYNIASLKDHARKACKRLGIDLIHIDEITKNQTLLIIFDLSNSDKHGYPPRDGGHSGRSPQVKKAERYLRMTTSGEPGSVTTVTVGPGGMKSTGDGSADVTITADVVDANGLKIGDAHELCVEALGVWETGLTELGLL